LASHRTVPLPDVVVPALRQHLERFPVQRPDRLVFTTTTGRPSAAPGSPARSGDPPSQRQARVAEPASTTCGTTTPRCSSGTANPSRPCNTGSGMPQRPRPSTPTHTSGPTPRTGPGTPSTRSCNPPAAPAPPSTPVRQPGTRAARRRRTGRRVKGAYRPVGSRRTRPCKRHSLSQRSGPSLSHR
jgi:hypothetical protein